MLFIRTPRRRKVSEWEERLHRLILAAGLPPPVREFTFHPTRRWRFDFAWLDHALAVEFEGAVFSNTKRGHTSGVAMTEDAEKYNAATLLGWRVLRFTERHIKNGQAIETIREAVAWSGEVPMFSRREVSR